MRDRGDRLTRRIPFYSVFKLVVFLYFALPQTQVSGMSAIVTTYIGISRCDKLISGFELCVQPFPGSCICRARSRH